MFFWVISWVLMGFALLGVGFAHAQDTPERDLIRILHDQPTYFIVGKPATKIQMSFKAILIKDSRLFVSYTQKVFWDIFGESSPFIDVNYNPAIFYQVRLPFAPNVRVDLIPYEHESNGMGGDKSRSWDRAGLRIVRGALSIRAWVPFNLDEKNKSISQYRGLYEIIYLVDKQLWIKIYPGGPTSLNPLAGGRELIWMIQSSTTKIFASWVIQVFQGTAENMVHFSDQTLGLRVGIGI